jgi:ribosomal protein S8E
MLRRERSPEVLLRVTMVYAAVGMLILIIVASTAQATVSISRAELSGTKLRIEGQAAANKTINVNGVAMGTSDGTGAFRIERDPFAKPDDCIVNVNDGSATVTSARLSGCTVSTPSSASLSALSLSPTAVVGGNSATGTITLTSAAPSGGLAVSLSSNDTAAATVPASVTVPAGSTSATFKVSTNSVNNSQSSTIIASAGGITRSATITVQTPFAAANGSISIIPGGNGSGRITSQPAGIDCTITGGNGTGNCSAFFPTGTIVRLDARPAAGSSFQDWRGLPGCSDPSKVKVAAGTNISCQPGFTLK